MLSSKLDSIIFTLMSMIRIWRVSISVEDKYKYLHLKMGSCQIHASGHYLPSSRVDNFSVRHFWKITTVLAPIGCPLHLLSPTCTRIFSHQLFHVSCSCIVRCKGKFMLPLELETKVHPKVRNQFLVESGYYRFHI